MKKKLIGLALLAGAIAAASKVIAGKVSDWQGLTESEVRQKVETRIPSRVPEEKRAAVADRVVTKMRDRGVLSEEPVPTSEPQSDDEASDVEPPADTDS